MNYFLVCLALLAIIYLINRVAKLEGRIKALTYTLDQVAKKIDVPENPINDDLRKLIKDGNDVEAVKVVREVLGLSLVEGHKYVDALKHEHN